MLPSALYAKLAFSHEPETGKIVKAQEFYPGEQHAFINEGSSHCVPSLNTTMSPLANRNVILPALVLVVLTISGTDAAGRYHIRLVNNCGFSVWPAWFHSGNQSQICPGGTLLEPTQEYSFFPSALWSGYFWARTGCSFNKTTGHGPCDTGGCNESLGCKAPGKSPFTTAEFLPNRNNGTMKYHISFLHGFNVPIEISEHHGYNCTHLSCPCFETMESCPSELVVMSGDKKVGCQSPCEKFGDERHCCRGNFTGSACQATEYSRYFKQSCKDATTYPADRDSVQVCAMAATYVVTFCPEDTVPVPSARRTIRRAII
ncbi:protein P21 isoform X2 [Selaginella moellendorffii]|uniref:protein P21 isoform X2 n=1 Tax=Selaginella moellendorffii TaxID=88036 RepID=UPI000D1C2A6B|nr:protein P21 isoform X2 [Selaginella moellendorffii]|eukprot:XP_024524679.1 protein P21 isoform X2 [Selaginella moellendorffii]